MSRARALSTARKATTRTSRRRSTPLRPSHRARVSTTLVSLSQDRVLALGSKCVCLEDEGLPKKRMQCRHEKGIKKASLLGRGQQGPGRRGHNAQSARPADQKGCVSHLSPPRPTNHNKRNHRIRYSCLRLTLHTSPSSSYSISMSKSRGLLAFGRQVNAPLTVSPFLMTSASSK